MPWIGKERKNEKHCFIRRQVDNESETGTGLKSENLFLKNLVSERESCHPGQRTLFTVFLHMLPLKSEERLKRSN